MLVRCLRYRHSLVLTLTENTSSVEDGYPYCRTYVYSTTATPDTSFSLLICEATSFSGIGTIYPDPATNPIIPPASTLTRMPIPQQLSWRFLADQNPGSSTVTSSSPTAGPSEQGSAPVGAIVGGVVGGLAVIGIVVLGLFYIFLRSRRKTERFQADASAALMKPDLGRSPTTVAASPAYASAEPDLRTQSLPDEHTVSPSDSQSQNDQRQPLISAETTPMEICENPRAGPTKDQVYAELPTHTYKSELPP